MDNKNSEIKKMIILWIIFIVIITLSIKFKLNKKIFSSLVILYGLITPIFSGVLVLLGTWIAAVPWIGPIIIKIITLPILWLLNGVASLTSLILVTKGESKKAVDARIISVMFFIGLLIGYVLGKAF